MNFIAHSRTDIDKLVKMVEETKLALEGIAVLDCDSPAPRIAKAYLAKLNAIAGEK
jgi:hypothetical protein